jgi:hypothetical protein
MGADCDTGVCKGYGKIGKIENSNIEFLCGKILSQKRH